MNEISACAIERTFGGGVSQGLKGVSEIRAGVKVDTASEDYEATHYQRSK